MKRTLCMLLCLVLCLSLLPPRRAQAAEEAPVFRVLLLGNEDAEDAADAGRTPEASCLPDILQAMLGEKAEITVGLCLLRGASLAEHAVQARDGGSVYTFETIRSGEGWRVTEGVTSAFALEWTDWDAVVLQPNEVEAASGLASPLCVEGYFYSMAESVPFLLEHVHKHAPGADAYLFVPWSRTEDTKPGAGLEDYSRIAAFMPKALAFPEAKRAPGFADLIPIGAALQNARSTYLAALDYIGDEDGDMLPDRQLGLQRDSRQLSLYAGRYIAALTLAETVVPAERREKEYALPPMGEAPGVGLLPGEYTKLAQSAVFSALDLWREKGSLEAAPISGMETDPVLYARKKLDGAKIPVTACSREPACLAGAVKKVLEERLFEIREKWPELRVAVHAPELSGEYPLYAAQVVLTYGYGRTELVVSGRLEFTESGHIWSRWLQPVAPTCTEPGLEMHYCCICGMEETRPVEPLVGIEESSEGLTLTGLPAEASAVAAGFSEDGRLVLLRLLRGEEIRLVWTEEGRPPVLKLFFLDGKSLPLSAPWEPSGD